MSGSWDRLAYLVFLCAAAVIVFTVGDYGITWDEPVQHIYGDLVYRYYASGFADRQAFEYRDLYLYGGAFDGLSAALLRLLPGKTLETRHVLGATIGLLGIIGSWKATRCVAGPRAALFAALLLATTPRWWGHSFNNPKDIPFAVGAIWSLYYVLRLVGTLPRPSTGLLMRLGISIGFTLGVRAGGLVLVAYLALVLFAHWALEERHLRGAARASWIFFGALTPAWLLMLACWPWAQEAPFARPFEALIQLGQFQPMYANLTTLYAGSEVAVADVPASYALRWLAITLPEGFLLLLATGSGLALFRLSREGVELRSLSSARYALLVFAAVFPVAFVTASGAPLYDGMRQLLFVVPPLACLAGCALDALCRLASTWPAPLRRAGIALCSVYGALHLGLMLQLHPHHTVYFNQLVGGLAGAEGRYELDYWGNSYREATLILVAHLEAEAESEREIGAARGAIGPFKVFVCSAPQSGSYFFPPYLSSTLERSEADFMLATTRFRCHERLVGQEIGRVERFDTLLALVTDLRPAPAR